MEHVWFLSMNPDTIRLFCQHTLLICYTAAAQSCFSQPFLPGRDSFCSTRWWGTMKGGSLDMEQNFLPVQWLSTEQIVGGCGVSKLGISRAVWTQSCALGWLCWSREVGPAAPLWLLPPWPIPWFCDDGGELKLPLFFPPPLWRGTPYLLGIALGSSNSCLMSLCTL